MSTSLAKRRSIDRRGWIALAWAAWFGWLYTRMVLEERAPGVIRTIERVAEPLRSGNAKGS